MSLNMATISPVDTPYSLESPSPTSPSSTTTGQIPLEQTPRPKRRHRLLQSLQRISSSPSLVRRTRSHSVGYQREGKTALSCVSLSSGACWGDPTDPASAYGNLQERIPTPPDSRPISPLPAGVRIRALGTLANGSQTTIPLPAEVRPGSRDAISKIGDMANPPDGSTLNEDNVNASPRTLRRTINFWDDIPDEIKMRVFRFLTPKEMVRCSIVSKAWHKMCFDGQLWASIDAAEFYRDISSDALVKLILSAGPFVRDLNLRGCVQLREKWLSHGERISDICRNVVNFCLEGCRIDKTAMHHLLIRNPRLEYINVCGLSTVGNSAMKIIAQSCPHLETLNISWCSNVDNKGLKRVVDSCKKLKDLRAGELHGFDDEELMQKLFESNTLQRLIIHRTDITDDALKILIHGRDPEIDLLTELPIAPPRAFKHLDLHQCASLTDRGVRALAYNVPLLEGLQLSQCSELSDESIVEVIKSTPLLTHLDLEDIPNLTNNTLIELAKAPCAACLEHLNVSYCETLGDSGMLPILKSCPNIKSIDMDNTRISDLSLMEASSRMRKRGYGTSLPHVGLRLVVFDCVNVTWAGIREVLSSNAYLPRALKAGGVVVTVTESADRHTSTSSLSSNNSIVLPSSCPPPAPMVRSYPNQIIQLKCFYGWQMTVDEHMKRVLRGDLIAANRLDRKWADYMMATEEAGATGAGARRRRRRAREAERLYQADDDEIDFDGIVPLVGRRRRARSGGCILM